MASSPANPKPHAVVDCRGTLQLLSDDTVVRSAAPPFPVGVDHDDGRFEWKDAVYDAGHGLGLFMYRPAMATTAVAEEGRKEKLSVVVYFHGGGFYISSFAWPNFHADCLRLAAELPAVVLSFDYRLGPKHRIPAAHEDAATTLLWLKVQLLSDPSLADVADSGRVFVSGESASGNLSHHLALRLDPVKIAGYVLLMPAFTSEKPTQSELDSPAIAFLTRDIGERYLRLALPAGANKDHPLLNQFTPESPSLEVADVGRMLVVAADGDLLRDKNVEDAERMKAMGKDVELVVFAGEEHAFFGVKLMSAATGELVGILRWFIAGAGTTE